MMKLFKKALAAVLTGAMVIGAMTFSAFADETTIELSYAGGAGNVSGTYTVTGDVDVVTADITTAVAEGDGAFNDWCGYAVKVTDADGTKSYYGFGGASVNWDLSVDAADAAEVAKGCEGANWLGAISSETGTGTIGIPVGGKDSVVDFYVLAWETFDGKQLDVKITEGGESTLVEVEPEEPGDVAAPEGPATATLSINKPDWSAFESEKVDAEITGDGSYTVSLNVTGDPINLGAFQAIDIAGGEAILGTACVITVDSIKINGEEITLAGKSYTCTADGKGVDTRVNLYNEYNDPNPEAVAGDDNHKEQRVAEGSVADASARIIPTDYIGEAFAFSSIEVAFTVSNFGQQAEAGEKPVDEVPDPKHDPITEFPVGITYGNAPSHTPDALYTVQSDVVYVTVTIDYDHLDTEGDGGWNDWCCNGLVVTNADGSQKVYAFGGKEVSWDVNVLGGEEADVIGGASNTDQYLQLDENGHGEFRLLVDGKGATLGVYALGWENYEGVQYTIQIVDADGAASSTDETSAAAPSEEVKDTTAASNDAPSTGVPFWVWIIIGCVVCVVVVVVVICVVKAKKKNN